jgi:hypothetical protein
VRIDIIFDPSDQRLEFFMFCVCFARGFFVTYMRCSCEVVCLILFIGVSLVTFRASIFIFRYDSYS